MMKKYLLTAVLVVGSCFSAFSSAEEFTIADLQFQGLQRVTLGAALLNLPIREGDSVDDYQLSKAIKALYASSYFDSIDLVKEGDVLIFKVKERPTISNVELQGNDKLKEEQILDSLKSSQIQVGEPLDRTTLASISKSLEDFYHSIGHYNAQVETLVTTLPRNRVSLQLVFNEGEAAKIEQINIVGNTVYSDEQLLKQLTLADSGGWWDFFAEDEYQMQKMAADLEVIKSQYLDNGYIRFQIEETQVALTPNKKGVYVTVNLDEGEVYKVEDVKFTGELLDKDALLPLFVPFAKGDIYAASSVSYAEQTISRFYGRLGYAYPEIKAYPEIDDETKTVVVVFSVKPGKRGYVRHINISGNSATKDVVLRREMRQMESGWLSSQDVETSKARLNRLGFFSKVDINTERISDDLVDLNINVEEQPSGSFNAGIGFGSDSGLSLNAGVKQDNFLGSGDKVAFEIKKNDETIGANVSYTTPYLTKDGVSGGGRIFFDKFEADDADIADYTNQTYGVRINTGFPINEINRLGLSLGWENNTLTQQNTYLQVDEFWNIYQPGVASGNDADFQNYDVSVKWTRNNLDRGQLATQGMKHSLWLKATLPGSDIQYYQAQFDFRNYQRISANGDWTTLIRASAAYGNGYGEVNGHDHMLPFFENYYVGGYRTLRGFAGNSAGPHAIYNSNLVANGIYVTDDAVGGNAKYTISAEFIFPVPFMDEAYSRQVRSSLFIDAGEAWDTEFNYELYSSKPCTTGCDSLADYSKPGRIRASMGTQFTWISPMGPLIFTLAIPLKEYAGDDTEIFSFNIGDVF